MLKAFRENGTEVRPGDTITDFRGDEAAFVAATRAPDGHRTGKITFTRPGWDSPGEVYMTVFDLTVRDVPASTSIPAAVRKLAVVIATALALALTAGTAHAATAGSGTWDARTCAAWNGHRIPAEVYADSRHADPFLLVDAGGWYRRYERHDRSASEYAGYVGEDCNGPQRNGYGL